MAWSSWRSGLVRELVARTAAVLADTPLPPAVEVWPDVDVGRAWVGVEEHDDGCVLVVGAPDRLGLLASVSAAITLGGLHVRAARAAVEDGVGWSRWEVAEEPPDPTRVRQRLLAALDGTLSLDRLRPPAGGDAPQVSVRPDDSARSTVLEVRDSDWTGLLHRVCSGLAGLGIEVRSAHVETLGPQAVDVFYVGEQTGGPLFEDRVSAAVEAVGRALRGGCDAGGSR